MSLTYTYTSLRTAVIAFTEDTGTEFAANLDDCIGRAEIRLLRDLDLELFDITTTGTMTGASPFITKPAGYLGYRSFYLGSTGSRSIIEEKSYDYILEYWPDATATTATPKYFCEYSDTQFMVGGTPSGNLPYTLRFMKRPDGLSGSTSTTWLSTYTPDALFHATMLEAELFLKADDRAQLWEGRYKDALSRAKREIRRATRDDYAPMTTTPPKEGE